jgi:O-antigen ligase
MRAGEGLRQPMGAVPVRQNRAVRVLEAGAIGTAFLIPLAFWPAAVLPFSTAKHWLLAAWVTAGCATAGSFRLDKSRRLPARLAWALALWITALALSAALGQEVSLRAFFEQLFPSINLLLLFWIAPNLRRMAMAIIGSGTAVSLVAILQFLQLDPFRIFGLAGSIQGSSRIQVFSTLGNPNFVAAFLISVLPLTFVCAGRKDLFGRSGARFLMCAMLLQAGAIVATGSRAPILAILASGTWLVLRRNRSWLRFLAAGLPVAAVLLVFSPARPLDKTVAGRVYVWKVIAKHVAGVPFSGFGPGAFPLRYAEWETEYLRTSAENADRSFVGFQDHAHNDYLEIVVDHGISGLAAFLLALCLAIPFPWRGRTRGGSLKDGIIAGIIGLLAIALVDFPLHRPTELYLFWTFITLLWSMDEDGSPLTQPCPELSLGDFSKEKRRQLS